MKKNADVIRIRGARVHNLRNVDVDIPRNKFVVITGISGSGKSSLAFDTLYADGQRRYVESLSAYARQFLGMMEKPDVDSIEGISPAIAIDQRSVSKNPRSTVGTITEIHDYLRLLFARVGIPHCPKCGRNVSKQSASQITSHLLSWPQGIKIMILAPIIRDQKGEHRGVLEEVLRAGFARVRVNGALYTVAEALALNFARYKKHAIEVVVDRLDIARDADTKLRLSGSVETALKMGRGLLIVSKPFAKQRESPAVKRRGSETTRKTDTEDALFSERFACEHCEVNLPELEPRLFSFNSPHGACPRCTGIGYQLEFNPALVVPNDRLNIAEGAIRPWMHASHRVGRQSWYWWQLSELADKLGFSLNTPWKDIPKNIQEVIFYGWSARSKSEIPAEGGFEGVMPNLMRRYKESESEHTRAELEQYMEMRECPACLGKRLKPEALAVTVAGKSIDEVACFTIERAQEFFSSFLAVSSGQDLTPNQRKIARPIAKEVLSRLGFLVNVGLHYLTLERSSVTLAGGEAQRIRLATQIGTRLVGVLYILDEPSIGLHARDQGRLIRTLKELRDLGNTVVVVEHDEQTIRAADWVIDVGPGAGKHGGRITFQGTPQQLLKSKTLTGEYLAGRRQIGRSADLQISTKSRSHPIAQSANLLVIRGAKEHNLKNIDVKIPLGKFVCVTGVSGSGKSTLVNDILARALAKHFWRTRDEAGAHHRIEGIEHIDKAILIDQSPIGRTPRSNPATYTGAFNYIRDLFSATKEARIRGYAPGRFSFNVKGGRCETCEGEGMQQIEMHFLPDVWVECGECHGKRYNHETLEIEWSGKHIAETLAMTIEDALGFFRDIAPIHSRLETLAEVGLGYMELGQAATTLSGGEAQRVKLATELARRATGKTLYLLDEPTTGLHPADIEKLLKLLVALVAKGNTVLVIEHNLDVIANADWIIDLGPEGGEKGGAVVAAGTPDEVMQARASYTGQYLRTYLR